MDLVSVSTVAFDGSPLDQALGSLAACGATSAELAYIEGFGDFDENAFSPEAARVARRSLEKARLASIAVSAHMDLGSPDALDKIVRRVAFCRGIGAHILITNTGAKDRAASVERAIEAVLPFCADMEVILALENPGHGSETLFGRAEEGAALARRFASPWLGLNYDVGNVLTLSEQAIRPEVDIHVALPFCVHAHLKDLRIEGPDWRYVAIGDGDVDYVDIATTLARVKPVMPVGLELPLRLLRPLVGRATRRNEPIAQHVAELAVRRSIAFWSRIRSPRAPDA